MSLYLAVHSIISENDYEVISEKSNAVLIFQIISGKKYDLRRLQKESAVYQDIVAFNFEDTYRNLTVKTLTSISWAVNSFNTQFILKIDDDMFPNVKEILHLLKERISGSNEVILGDCSRDLSVDRNKTSKYYVSYHDYPLNSWPPFCFGTGYVISSRAVRDLLEVTDETRLYHLEDVSLGLLARKVGNVKILNVNKWKGCTLDGKIHECPSTYTFHNVGPDTMEVLWRNCMLRPSRKTIHNHDEDNIRIINPKIKKTP